MRTGTLSELARSMRRELKMPVASQYNNNACSIRGAYYSLPQPRSWTLTLRKFNSSNKPRMKWAKIRPFPHYCGGWLASVMVGPSWFLEKMSTPGYH